MKLNGKLRNIRDVTSKTVDEGGPSMARKHRYIFGDGQTPGTRVIVESNDPLDLKLDQDYEISFKTTQKDLNEFGEQKTMADEAKKQGV